MHGQPPERVAATPHALAVGPALPEPPERRDLQEKSIPELIGALFREVSTLIDRQMALVRLEAWGAAAEAGRATAVVTVGGILAVVGLVYLALAAVALLARAMPDWAAAGLVGLALAVVGAIVLNAGLGTLRSIRVAPRVTVERLKEDRAWLSQRIRSSGR